MNLERINYDAGVMFVFRGRTMLGSTPSAFIPRGRLWNAVRGRRIQIRAMATTSSAGQVSATRNFDAGLLLGYYTPDGSVHTFDDGDEHAWFDRIATIRAYMLKAVERQSAPFEKVDKPAERVRATDRNSLHWTL